MASSLQAWQTGSEEGPQLALKGAFPSSHPRRTLCQTGNQQCYVTTSQSPRGTAPASSSLRGQAEAGASSPAPLSFLLLPRPGWGGGGGAGCLASSS